MTTVNYPSPVLVNGYSCKNCTDVDNAKRNIDPAHPHDGPFGVDAQSKPAAPTAADTPAVTFGGALAGLVQADKTPVAASATQGHKLDLSV